MRARIPRWSPLIAWLPLAVLSAATDAGAAAQDAADGPSSVVMGNTPLVLPEVGLQADIPADATSFRADRGNIPTIEVSPFDGRWILIVQAPPRRVDMPARAGPSPDGRTFVDDLTESILETLLAGYRVDGDDGRETNAARVLLRETGLLVGGRPASRFYVSFPEGADARERIRMYTLIDAGAGQMVSFDLTCEPEDQREARLAYLASLGTARFTANATVAAERALAIEAGMTLLGNLGQVDYARALEAVNGRWDRLYTPASTGLDTDATERGYRRIRAWEGFRGEINPETDRESWNADEQRPGFLVQLDGRLIDPPGAGGVRTIVDTRSTCFLSYDRTEEAWITSTAITAGERRVVTTEYGSRQGDDMNIARRGAISNTLKPAVPPRGYLSQVELYLLPQLLVGVGAPAEYGFYAYAGGDDGIRFRRFALDAADGAAAWQLVADFGSAGEDAAASITLFERDGTPLGTDRPDGTRWQATTRDKLLDLWRRKGLPTGSAQTGRGGGP
ncbi:MAG: hypothetical protein AAFX79_00980 [Planctomycetota bacterium]